METRLDVFCMSQQPLKIELVQKKRHCELEMSLK